MPYKNYGNNPPRQDTGWGLIFRLNGILNKIEYANDNGNLGAWNNLMDRVYINIVFKNPEEIIKDEDGKVTDIKFSKDDIEVFSKINERITEIKKNIESYKRAEEIEKFNIEMNKLYNQLIKKDIWLRKKLFQFNLYLRQVEHDPRRAIYGG